MFTAHALQLLDGSTRDPASLERSLVNRHIEGSLRAELGLVLAMLGRFDEGSIEIERGLAICHELGQARESIEDDGTGFDTASTGYGTGLQGIAHRLDAIGGRLEVRPAPGEGTTITGRIRRHTVSGG